MHVSQKVALFALAFSLTACSGVQRPKTGLALANALMPPKEENELGKKMSAEVEGQVRLLKDDAVVSYVRKLGTLVSKQATDTPSGISYTFNVVDAPDTVNAFALPGGYIYVYTGLLAKAENESELVAVLAHEVAHVSQRHVAKRMVAAYGLQAVMSAAVGGNPGLVGEMVSNVVSNGVLLKHSRDGERNADEVGLRYAIGAGYSPAGYVTFFTKMAEEEHPPTLLASHPNPEERVRNARREIADLKAGRGGKVGVEDYAPIKARLGKGDATDPAPQEGADAKAADPPADE